MRWSLGLYGRVGIVRQFLVLCTGVPANDLISWKEGGLSTVMSVLFLASLNALLIVDLLIALPAMHLSRVHVRASAVRSLVCRWEEAANNRFDLAMDCISRRKYEQSGIETGG